MRGQQEIVERIAEIGAGGDGFFGFGFEVLVASLDFEHAKLFLRDDVTAEDWTPVESDAQLEAVALEYLVFAIDKIKNHRGISASRSVSKLTEYAWLLGRDDVIAAMNAAHYPQYGAPQIKAFAKTLGWPWPDEAVELNRMADGLSCDPDGCYSGCGGL